MTAEECVEALTNQKLRKIDDLPDTVGVYALTDHLGHIHYIGITAANSFRDRIYSRHVNGSEERSHKLACNYNIGRMWRDRKSADHVPHDAKIAKDLRREFIRRHCLAACIPLDYTEQALEALEKMIFAIVSPDMISWNATRTRVNGLSEPRDLVDGLIKELGLSLDERAALDRQAKLFEKHAGGGYAVSRHSEISALFENVGKMQPSPQPEDGNEERVDNVDVVFPIHRPRGFERFAADGERYVVHCFRDGLYRMADPALGRAKHHAKNQLAVTFEEIRGYLRRGYLLRMRGELCKQVNLISPSEIKVFY